MFAINTLPCLRLFFWVLAVILRALYYWLRASPSSSTPAIGFFLSGSWAASGSSLRLSFRLLSFSSLLFHSFSYISWQTILRGSQKIILTPLANDPPTTLPNRSKGMPTAQGQREMKTFNQSSSRSLQRLAFTRSIPGLLRGSGRIIRCVYHAMTARTMRL